MGKASFARRAFLRLVVGSAAFAALRPHEGLGKHAAAIDKITMLRVPGAFYRPIAMNACDGALKGQVGSTRLARVLLSDGTTGLGVEGYVRVDDEAAERLRQMIGTSPLDVYQWEEDCIHGVAPSHRAFIEDPRYAWFETPLLDAVGKLKEKPVYELFGSSLR